jgi:hypothetical protein
VRLPGKTSLNVGYDFSAIDRAALEHAEDTQEHDVSVRLKNAASDLVTTRIKYQHIFRDSESGLAASDFAPLDPDSIELYQGHFDVADKDRDVVGIGFDLTPTERLDVSLEYAFTKDDYDGSILGLQEETRHEACLDLSYKLPRNAGFGAFAGYEWVSADQRSRQFNPGNNPNPDSGSTATAFNWTEDLRSDNWSIGLWARVPVVKDAMDLAASWNYQNSDGEGLFTSTGRALEDIDASNDYTKNTLKIEAIFRVSKQLDAILGFLHEELDYTDDQWKDYKYASANVFLSGAYSDTDYVIDVGYLKMKYRF